MERHKRAAELITHCVVVARCRICGFFGEAAKRARVLRVKGISRRSFSYVYV